MRQEPESKIFDSIEAAKADAKARRISVWYLRCAWSTNGYDTWASATYDGLHNDFGWHGSSGYEFIETYRGAAG